MYLWPGNGRQQQEAEGIAAHTKLPRVRGGCKGSCRAPLAAPLLTRCDACVQAVSQLSSADAAKYTPEQVGRPYECSLLQEQYCATVLKTCAQLLKLSWGLETCGG